MKKSLLVIIISLLVNMVNLVMVSPVYGPVYATVYVNPPSIIDTTKTAGTTFTVDINVKNATDLYGFDFFLNYTTTVLTATGITLGSFFPSNAFVAPVPGGNINDALGYVLYMVLMPPTSQVGMSGSGTLATISFTVDSIGESPLDLDLKEFFDSDMVEMDRNAYDGYFSNILRPTRLYVDPENTINPDLVQDENFTINVSILNATDLFSYEFFLNYTTAVLTATNVTLGSFFPSDSQIVHEEINDTLGYVWYNVTMPLGSPSGMSGDGILANITFTVDSIGETPLDLCNPKLVNSEGEPIEHDTLDGFFSNKPLIRDIVITDITTTITTVEVQDNMTIFVPKTVSEVHAGEKLNVTVYVKNNGTVTESFNVTAYYDDNIIDTKNVTDLSEGFSITLPFEWNTEGVAEGNHTIWAEASAVAGEINTTNNRFTKKGEFRVLPPMQSFPIEFVLVAVIVLVIAATAVYFIKFRKPKPA